jgi:hypothetical protein
VVITVSVTSQRVALESETKEQSEDRQGRKEGRREALQTLRKLQVSSIERRCELGGEGDLEGRVMRN